MSERSVASETLRLGRLKRERTRRWVASQRTLDDPAADEWSEDDKRAAVARPGRNRRSLISTP